MPRVFTRLYRADNVLIQGVGDTGVGLSIAKTLTEAQNGRIWVESRGRQRLDFQRAVADRHRKPGRRTDHESPAADGRWMSSSRSISLLLVIGGISLSLAETLRPATSAHALSHPFNSSQWNLPRRFPLPRNPLDPVHRHCRSAFPTATLALAQPVSCTILQRLDRHHCQGRTTRSILIAERYKTTADNLDTSNCLNNAFPPQGSSYMFRPFPRSRSSRAARHRLGQSAHRPSLAKTCTASHFCTGPQCAIASRQLHGIIHHHSCRSSAVGAERADQHAGDYRGHRSNTSHGQPLTPTHHRHQHARFSTPTTRPPTHTVPTSTATLDTASHSVSNYTYAMKSIWRISIIAALLLAGCGSNAPAQQQALPFLLVTSAPNASPTPTPFQPIPWTPTISFVSAQERFLPPLADPPHP